MVIPILEHNMRNSARLTNAESSKQAYCQLWWFTGWISWFEDVESKCERYNSLRCWPDNYQIHLQTKELNAE